MVQKHKTHDSERTAVVQRQSKQAAQTHNEHEQVSQPANVWQRSVALPPAALRPADVLTLQRTVGNRAVQRMLIQRTVEPEPLRGHSLSRRGVESVVSIDLGLPVHYNSAGPQIYAEAFSQRQEPQLGRHETHVIPHEAWHVVEPRLGRVTRTTNILQTKLAVGPANDHYEQDADRVAATVMQTSGPAAPQIQRQGLEEEDQTIQTKPLVSTITPLIQRQESDETEEDVIQRRSDARSDGSQSRVESGVEDVIERTRGGGQPLPAALLGRMENSFGADFSGVRVHADSQSDTLNRSLHARAFTTGHDMFFRRGEYNPDSRRGQELIAHELTHVVQQNGGTSGKKNLSLQRSTSRVIQRGVWDWLKGKFSAAEEYVDEQRGEFKKDVRGDKYGNIDDQEGEEYRRKNYNEDLAKDVANYAVLGAGGVLTTARIVGDKGQAIKDLKWAGILENTAVMSEAGRNLSGIAAGSAGLGVAAAGVDAYKGFKEFDDRAKTSGQRGTGFLAGFSGLGNVAQQSATTVFHTANNLTAPAVATGAEIATGGAALFTGAFDIGRGIYAMAQAEQSIDTLRAIRMGQNNDLIKQVAAQAKSTQEIRRDTAKFTAAKGILSAIGGALLVGSAFTPIGWILIGAGALIGLAGAVKKWSDKKKRREEIVMDLLEFTWEQKKLQREWNATADKLKGGLKVWKRFTNREAIAALGESPVEKVVKAKGYVSVDHYYSNYISKTADDLYKLGRDQRNDLVDKAQKRIDKWDRLDQQSLNAEKTKKAVKNMPFEKILKLPRCHKLKDHLYGQIVKLLNAMGLRPAFQRGEPTPEKIGKALHE